MKQLKYKILLLLVVVGAVLILLLSTCDKDSRQNISGPAGPTAGVYDPVFNADGGFVITYGMLDRRFNEISFPGTHNSYAGVGSNWPLTCKNQGLTIAQQLENGIRYIEFDINDLLYVCHGACIGHFNERLMEVRDYARNHPGQVITARIADCVGGLGPLESYGRVNGRLEDTGLDAYVYNWDPTKAKDDPRRCYIPDPWPTLREMINSGKNVIFLHERTIHYVVDEGYCLGAKYGDNGGPAGSATIQEQFSRYMVYWAPPQIRQSDAPYRLFLMEFCADGGDLVNPAGDKESAAKNNDGRRLYQVAKHFEEVLLNDNRAPNFINVDYFRSSNAGHLPIDVVDACNRLNHERFGIDWETSEAFWELYPYEFDDTRKEYVTQLEGIQAELDLVVADLKAQRNLDGHEDKGQIVATTYHTPFWDRGYDWKCLPEWAVDNDLWTRWCGSSSGDNHTWGIDLGERKKNRRNCHSLGILS